MSFSHSYNWGTLPVGVVTVLYCHWHVNHYQFCFIGSVKVWDPRQANDPVASMEPAEGETRRDCWTVAFGNSYNDTERCVCAGYDNGDIKMFDMRKMSCRWETNVKNGVSEYVMITVGWV